MMFKFFSKLFDNNEKQIKSYASTIESINSLESKYKDMPYEEMRAIVSGWKEEMIKQSENIAEEERDSIKSTFRDGKKYLPKEEIVIKDKLLEIRGDAFAMLREVAGRKMDRRHFDVQIIGGLVLSEGKIGELKTGEGKTQIAHLPLFLYGLTGRGSHLVTVNDYLTKRDGEYAGHILSELGLSLGIITSQGSYKFITDEEIKKIKGEEIYNERMSYKIQNPGDVKGVNLIEVNKQEAYKCDVVYGTNNEFGFDYLRDNMVRDSRDRVQRELFFCIVDEVDSILIDEARTPLIISTSAEKSNELYTQFAKIVQKLEESKDYEVDEKAHSAVLTDEGIQTVEKMLGVKNLWEDYQLAHHLENALKAMALYKNEDEYLVRDGQIIIIDSFTGRALAGRRYSEGLHQAIEAKEGVEIQRESKTLATITFQNFFRIYRHLSGMTGTAETEAEEFYKIYALDTIVIPTARPIGRIDKTDRVYKNQQVKFKAVVNEIKERNKKGQPVLVGTTSVDKSEILSEMLRMTGVEHQVLNAKHHEKEAQIVSNAGAKGSVTIATNMAGRGTDIKISPEVAKLGGLYVIGTERHESRRIDNQLRGRSGRLGDPGESRFFVALDDEIMRIQGGEIVKNLMDRTNMDENIPIEAAIIGKTIENAQKKMEGMNFDIRKRVVEYDDVMNQQRTIFYVRRRGVIRNFENAVERDDKESLDKLLSQGIEALTLETESIVNRHFLAERDDDIDKRKIIDEFLDMGDDQFLIDCFKEATGNDDLSVLLDQNMMQEDIIKQLEETVLLAFDKKKEALTEKGLGELTKAIFLETMDQSWTDHLELMQDMREGIGLRGYAQRNPLVEYKNEGFGMFQAFIEGINTKFAHRVLKVVTIRSDENMATQKLQTNSDEVQDILTGSRDAYSLLRKAVANVAQNQPKETKQKVQKTVKNDTKIGRNDACPCGSGKKYKKCHGKEG